MTDAPSLKDQVVDALTRNNKYRDEFRTQLNNGTIPKNGSLHRALYPDLERLRVLCDTLKKTWEAEDYLTCENQLPTINAYLYVVQNALCPRVPEPLEDRTQAPAPTPPQEPSFFDGVPEEVEALRRTPSETPVYDHRARETRQEQPPVDYPVAPPAYQPPERPMVGPPDKGGILSRFRRMGAHVDRTAGRHNPENNPK